MDIFLAVISAIVIGLLSLLFGSWFAMLFLGAAHASDGRIPALGYEATVWLNLAIGTVVGGSVKAAATSRG